ncbi:hypothetical protein GCM10009720_21200 [Yaniella flava]|uniref:Uncharacterized protein n=1 Tax=Yaniella flava TaxID=287930 RepID=A0ABP5G785_9MICC
MLGKMFRIFGWLMMFAGLLYAVVSTLSHQFNTVTDRSSGGKPPDSSVGSEPGRAGGLAW